MVWWEGGSFRKDLYRHVKIKWVEGVDDYSMIRETVVRALGALEGRSPDLVIADGGTGQLEMARAALDELGINPEAIGVAKRPDRAFLGDGAIIDLTGRNSASLLLRRLRDEAHRFIIGFHRRLRDKRLTESQLEKIPGVGRGRRLILLRHFGSIEGIRRATAEELAAVKGITAAAAEAIFKYMQEGTGA
jgi:excinuclease ABC subunit C